MGKTLEERLEVLRHQTHRTELDEAATKQYFILPVLKDLGWDVFKIYPPEVFPEYRLDDYKADYALLSKFRPKVLLEAKRIGSTLKKHREQLLKYAFKYSVSLAVLTDGAAWWFFLPTAAGEWESRIFDSIEINLLDPSKAAEKFSAYLSKEAVLSGAAEKLANSILEEKQMAYKARMTIPEAWRSLLREKSDLKELLKKKTVDLCGIEPQEEDLNKFLLRLPIDPFGAGSSHVNVPYGSIKARVFGREVSVRTWKDLYVLGVSQLESKSPQKFKRMLFFKRNNKKYFSDKKDEFPQAFQVNRSEIYARTVTREDYVKNLLPHFVKFLKFPTDSIEIY